MDHDDSIFHWNVIHFGPTPTHHSTTTLGKNQSHWLPTHSSKPPATTHWQLDTQKRRFVSFWLVATATKTTRKMECFIQIYFYTHLSAHGPHIERGEHNHPHFFHCGMYNVYWIQPDTTRSVTFTQANVGVSLVCVLCVMGECESHPPSSLLVWSARKSMKESLLDRLANQYYY